MGAAKHWVICLLHLNELPFRWLFTHIDGVEIGPGLFKGPIGKSLHECWKLPIQNFKQIFSDDLPVLPLKVRQDLSTDQKYLYNLCHAIQSGNCTASLAASKPGNLIHSRFLTTANAVLRVYMATINPSKELQLLSKYIVAVYAPVWFHIKWKWSVSHGSRHFFMLAKLIKEHMPSKIHQNLFEILSRNSYFSHCENILLSMLVDEDINSRELAVQLIRKHVSPHDNIRTFKKPTINFEAQVYHEMIDFDQEFSMPPVLFGVSDEKLDECIESHQNFLYFWVNKIPCHTQDVERTIQIVSEASKKVFRESSRHERVLATLSSRNILPKTRTKSDYKNLL